jgi:hypothetical protein
MERVGLREIDGEKWMEKDRWREIDGERCINMTVARKIVSLSIHFYSLAHFNSALKLYFEKSYCL